MGRKKTARQNVMAQVKLCRSEWPLAVWVGSDKLLWVVELNGTKIGYVFRYKNRGTQINAWHAYLFDPMTNVRQRDKYVGSYRNGSTDPADMTHDPTAAKKRAVEELLVAYDRSLDS